jgi:hypothetical protein
MKEYVKELSADTYHDMQIGPNAQMSNLETVYSFAYQSNPYIRLTFSAVTSNPHFLLPSRIHVTRSISFRKSLLPKQKYMDICSGTENSKD